MGTLIVIEGGDASGKETQSKMLVERLLSEGQSAVRYEVPIEGNWTHKKIRSMLKSGSALKYPNLFQLIQFMNKWLFQTFTLRKVLKNTDYVVLDRWVASNVVYGLATNVWYPMLRVMQKFLVEPDITFVMYGSSYKKNPEDVYEQDTSLQTRVKALYYQWGTTKDNCYIVSTSGAKTTIHNSIWSKLRTYISIFN